MAGQKTELKIRIIGEDGVTKILDKTKKKAKEVENQTDALADATESWGDQISSGKKEFALLAVGINAATEIMSKLVGFGQDLVDTLMKAATQDAVGAQFARSFGKAADAMERFQTASAGTLGKQQLQSLAIQLQQAGRSAGDIEGLLDIATKIAASGVGAAKGILTTADAMEILSDSIIGASDSDLEKIGVLFDMPDAADKLAKNLGKVKDKGLESKAIFEFIMKDLPKRLEGVDIAGSAVVQAQRLQAEMQNTSDLWDQRAATILKAGRDITRSSNEAAAASVKAFQGYEMTLTGLEGSVISLTDAVEAGNTAFLEARQKTLDLMAADAALERSHKILGMSTADATRITRAYTDAQNDSATAARNIADAEFQVSKALFESNRQRSMAKAEGDAAELKRLAKLRWTRGAARTARLEKEAREAARRGGGGKADDVPTFKGFQTQAEGARKTLEFMEAAEMRMSVAAFDAAAAQSALATEIREANEAGIWERNQLAMDASADSVNRWGEAVRGSFDSASQAIRAFGDDYGSIASKVGSAGSVIQSEVQRVSGTLAEFKAAGKTSDEAWAASASGMIASSGALAASFIDDQMVKSIVMHFAEAAAAISSFAVMDIQGGVLHSLASAMWGVSAGIAGSKGKGGGGGARAAGGTGSRPPSFGDSTDGSRPTGDTINITVMGNLMNDVQMERSVTRALANGKRRRGDSPGDFMGAR